MKSFFSVIFKNFLGYDLVIFIAAVITGVIYYRLSRSAETLYNKMHLTVFVPDGDTSRREADSDMSEIRETDLVQMRNKTGRLYSIFVNLTGIFPLLGILGTVVSLLGLADDTANITDNFYIALTSTFWGLVFAITFKFLDGVICARIEDNEKNVDLFLERNSLLAKEMREEERFFGKDCGQAPKGDERRSKKEECYSAVEIVNMLTAKDDKR